MDVDKDLFAYIYLLLFIILSKRFYQFLVLYLTPANIELIWEGFIFHDLIRTQMEDKKYWTDILMESITFNEFLLKKQLSLLKVIWFNQVVCSSVVFFQYYVVVNFFFIFKPNKTSNTITIFTLQVSMTN